MRATIIIIAIALATGCRSSTYATTDELKPALSSSAVLLPVEPALQESENACGVACIDSLLRYHALALDDDARRRFPKEKQSAIAAGELRDYLRARGLRAYLVHGTLDAAEPAGIHAILARSLPVIVEFKLASSNHYVLVCGFDPEKKWMLIMDPAHGIAAVEFAQFEQYWAPTEHLMLVAARAGAK